MVKKIKLSHVEKKVIAFLALKMKSMSKDELDVLNTIEAYHMVMGFERMIVVSSKEINKLKIKNGLNTLSKKFIDIEIGSSEGMLVMRAKALAISPCQIVSEKRTKEFVSLVFPIKLLLSKLSR